MNKEYLTEVIETLKLSKDDLKEIACSFRRDMEIGLEDPTKSASRMLNSYIGLPEGNEQGEYLALDFGGTNVRVVRIKLLGNSQHEVVCKVAKPLVTAEYNLINKDNTAEKLFDFIAGIVDDAVEGDKENTYYLGHTFSFPSFQTDVYNAKLISWTKEFAVQGVEGEVVNDLLYDALKRRGFANVKPVAVINDTVAVLLAAAYTYPDSRIGSIYATGANSCYMEEKADFGRPANIINMECGAFNKLATANIDNEMDDASEKPGEQRFEKMISGRYMGELFSRVMATAFAKPMGSLKLTAIDMSAILQDVEDEKTAETIKAMKRELGCEITAEEAQAVQKFVQALSTRSARLVAASFAGIAWHIAGKGAMKDQHIAVDGSVYQHMPQVKENVMRALYEILDDDAAHLMPVLVHDGSSLGAAIAAAVSVN